ncbi:MAG: hypothetical protein JNK33_01910 [Candidatus Doudnabacteria bacterium]|nr:hypothetical protein [Candidatus Doudnabacteria bacterium]
MLPTFYISDCSDDNVRVRYAARIAAATPQAGAVQFVGVTSDLEAAGNLVDLLDGLEGAEALIFVNVAPRGTQKTKWPNGTPFGYLQWNHSYIFTTIDGYTLSLLQKISEAPLNIQVFDIPTVVPFLTPDTALQARITKSQFRSFDFLPRVAGHILGGNTVPTEPLNGIPEAPTAVWWTDNFGNAKTTLLTQDFIGKPADIFEVRIGGTLVGSIPVYDRLKDLPHGEVGIYAGSSGFGAKRFMEITKQKGESLLLGETSRAFNLKSGDVIELKKA